MLSILSLLLPKIHRNRLSEGIDLSTSLIRARFKELCQDLFCSLSRGPPGLQDRQLNVHEIVSIGGFQSYSSHRQTRLRLLPRQGAQQEHQLWGCRIWFCSPNHHPLLRRRLRIFFLMLPLFPSLSRLLEVSWPLLWSVRPPFLTKNPKFSPLTLTTNLVCL